MIILCVGWEARVKLRTRNNGINGAQSTENQAPTPAPTAPAPLEAKTVALNRHITITPTAAPTSSQSNQPQPVHERPKQIQTPAQQQVTPNLSKSGLSSECPQPIASHSANQATESEP